MDFTGPPSSPAWRAEFPGGSHSPTPPPGNGARQAGLDDCAARASWRIMALREDHTVLLIGASGGIGAALAEQLAHTQLTVLSRSSDGLDITDEAAVMEAATELDGPFDLIFDATGALEVNGQRPEKALAEIDPETMAAQFALNAIGPALLLKHFAPKLVTDRPSVFATLSARVGSIEDNLLGGWISYRASKAALNQIVRTAAIEIGRRNKQAIVVALHPGTVATPLSAKYLSRHPSFPPKEAAGNLLRVIERLQPAHSGGFYDYAMGTIPW